QAQDFSFVDESSPVCQPRAQSIEIFMRITRQVVAIAIVCLNATSLLAGETAREKEFVNKYKAAFEAKDTATLESFLYTKEAHPTALGFYRMMQSNGAGQKISKIELVEL